MGSKLYLAGVLKGWLYLGIAVVTLVFLLITYERRYPATEQVDQARTEPSVSPPIGPMPGPVEAPTAEPDLPRETVEAEPPVPSEAPAEQAPPATADTTPPASSAASTEAPASAASAGPSAPTDPGAASTDKDPTPADKSAAAAPPTAGDAPPQTAGTVASAPAATSPVVTTTVTGTAAVPTPIGTAVGVVTGTTVGAAASPTAPAAESDTPCPLTPAPVASRDLHRGLRLSEPLPVHAQASGTVVRVDDNAVTGFTYYIMDAQASICRMYGGMTAPEPVLAEGAHVQACDLLGTAAQRLYYQRLVVPEGGAWWQGKPASP